MVKEFKDWLFVDVKGYVFESGFEIWDGCLWQCALSPKITLPPGSWQIIGKGDGLGESDWHSIIGVLEGDDGFYENFDHTNFREVTAIDSSKTLLKSFEMEPGTTLILKKNEK